MPDKSTKNATSDGGYKNIEEPSTSFLVVKHQSPFDVLPNDLLTIIFSHLDSAFVLTHVRCLSSRFAGLTLELYGVLSLSPEQTENLLSSLPIPSQLEQLSSPETFRSSGSSRDTDRLYYCSRILHPKSRLENQHTIRLYNQFKTLSGIDLCLSTHQCRRTQLLFLLFYLLPPSIRFLSLRLTKEDSLSWIEGREYHRNVLRSSSFSERSQELDFKGNSGSRNAGQPDGYENCLRDSPPLFRCDDDLWLRANDWHSLFSRFVLLEELNVTLSSKLGYFVQPSIELEMPATMLSDDGMCSPNYNGLRKRGSVLGSLRRCCITGITSRTLFVHPHCVLPSLLSLFLGFVEVNIGRHDIR